MKWYFVLLLFLTNFYCYSQTKIKKQQIDQHLYYEGKLADVYIDKMLYLHSSTPSFLAKITIKNKTSRQLGVDLGDYWKVVYPNQYGIHNAPRRDEINEGRIIPDSLNKKKKDALKKAFKENTLTLIPPNGKIQYYRDFNSGKKENLLIKKEEFLIISFDGQLFITDGKEEFERVFVKDGPNEKTDLVIKYPVGWGNISNPKEIINKK
ncbi:MAG: hypothetical protein HY958_13115 [Bacteroidia bacterium]|nr:hypothetical protein [Bacteroidia bacterium]